MQVTKTKTANSPQTTLSKMASYTSANNNMPYLCAEVDMSKVTFADVVAGKTSATFKSAFINYDRGGLVIQTPWLKTWDGIAEQAEEFRQAGAPPKYSLNFSMRGQNAEEVAQFQSFLQQMDDIVLTEATNNSLAWLKRKGTRDVCAALFCSQLKWAKDKDTGEPTDKYPPSFKVKVPFYDGKWKCDLYDDKREEITENLHEHLTGQCDVRAVLKCSAVWIAGGKFGVTWLAQQLEYRPRYTNAHTYQFRATIEDARPEDAERAAE